VSASRKGARFTWERAVMGEHGPPEATTRHVLLTLATHANPEMTCWPSIEVLSKETSLSVRSVGTHLQLAAQDGWIQRTPKRQGKNWKNYFYTLTMPSPRAVAAATGSGANGPHAPAGRSAASSKAPKDAAAPPPNGAATSALAPEPDDKMLRKDVHTNIVMNNSLNSLKNITGAKPFKDFGLENNPTPIEQWGLKHGITPKLGESVEDYRKRVTQKWTESQEASISPHGVQRDS